MKDKNSSQIESLYTLFKEEFIQLKGNKEIIDFWKLMNENEIKTISENDLFTLGIHGQWHTAYTAIGIKEAVKESLRTQKYLQKITDKKIVLLAYPFGSYDTWLVAALFNKGFTKQLVCDYKFGKNDSKEIVKNRFIINPFLDTKTQMEFLKRGKYS